MTTDIEHERINSFLDRPLLARLATVNPAPSSPCDTGVVRLGWGEPLVERV
jgi:hypothetical protein